MIPFNAPPVVGTELDYMQSAMGSGKLCGDGGFTRRCQQWLEQRFGSAKVLLTPSCTASLEMAALLLDIQPGDEVIMPQRDRMTASSRLMPFRYMEDPPFSEYLLL